MARLHSVNVGLPRGKRWLPLRRGKPSGSICNQSENIFFVRKRISSFWVIQKESGEMSHA